MKKIIFSVLIVSIVFVIRLLIKIVFFNKTIPTGDINGEFKTTYSSKDMLGNRNITIEKKLYHNIIYKSVGTMNISSLAGNYFNGSITINAVNINSKNIEGGKANINGYVYNDMVTLYFDYKEEYLEMNYDAKFTPKILKKINFELKR